MKNKVLVIGPLPPPTGGIGTVVEQMKSMDIRGYNISIFNTSKNKIIKSNLIFNTLNFMYRCLKLINILLIERPRIIHIHTASHKSFWQNNIYHKICKIFHKRTILHMHGGEFEKFYNSANQSTIVRTLQSADMLIVLTEGWKKFYEHINANKNIVVVPNAVNLDVIKKYYSYRTKSSKTIKLLFVGRIERQKGIYELLKATSILKDKEIQLYIMGQFMNNEKEIRDLCAKYKITDKVTFLGLIQGNDRFKHFANSDLFVLPSYYESFGIAILEAMAFGLTIISTNVGGIPEIVAETNGILVQPRNVNQLVKAIKVTINSPLERKQFMRNNILKSKVYSLTKFKYNIEESYNVL